MFSLVLLQTPSVEEQELQTETILGLVFFVLFLCIAVSHLIEHYEIHFLHESGSSIILGLLFGALVLVIRPDNLTEFQFDDAFFFTLLLPPIIFSAAYNLKKKNFFVNFRLIMAMGIVATFINYFIIATACLQINNAGWISTISEGSGTRLDHGECLLFGAVMSPSDSVTVCTLLDPRVYPNLFGVLSGEGIINDALAIALYRSTFVVIDNDPNPQAGFPDPGLLGNIMAQFLISFVGSAAIGVGAALLSARYFKSQDEHPHPKRELAVIFLVAYVSYAVCEVLEWSGIIALLFCGIAMSHYTYHNLSDSGKHASKEGFEALGFVAETFLFMSLGFYVFHYSDIFNWSFVFFISMLLTLFLSRAFCVILIVNIVNLCQKEKYKLDWKRQFLIWWGGVIRGAIAFALAVDGETDHKPILVTTAFAIVMFTTLILGGMTLIAIQFVHLQPTIFGNGNKPKLVHRGSLFFDENKRVSMRHSSRFAQGIMRRFDDKFMKPLFGGRTKKSNVTHEVEEVDGVVHSAAYQPVEEGQNGSEKKNKVEDTVSDAPDDCMRPRRYSDI